jgi:hypothetical protein
MAEEFAVATAALAVGGYVGTKLFGAALANMGDDINKLYAKGRDRIVEIATRKTSDANDGKTVNLRAARDVLWNGSITDDEVCAEYFGGMLAAARSDGGKDDGVVHYVDTIKAMSARQLELHYVIYSAWHQLLKGSGRKINVGKAAVLLDEKIFLAGKELGNRKLPYDRDLTILMRLGLLSSFEYTAISIEDKALPYACVQPTTFGVMLFAIAHNKLDTWRDFPAETYESAAGIAALQYCAPSLDALCNAVGMPPRAADGQS